MKLLKIETKRYVYIPQAVQTAFGCSELYSERAFRRDFPEVALREGETDQMVGDWSALPAVFEADCLSRAWSERKKSRTRSVWLAANEREYAALPAISAATRVLHNLRALALERGDKVGVTIVRRPVAALELP